MSDNLKFEEEELKHAFNKMRKNAQEMELLVDKYINCLKTINLDTVVSGETSKALKEFIGVAEALRGQATGIMEKQYQLESRYLEAIDDADKFLY